MACGALQGLSFEAAGTLVCSIFFACNLAFMLYVSWMVLRWVRGGAGTGPPGPLVEVATSCRPGRLLNVHSGLWSRHSMEDMHRAVSST